MSGRVDGSESSMPPLPQRERRDRQVKIRLTPSEIAVLQELRPDLTPAGIIGVLVDDVLMGRYRPEWAASNRADNERPG